MKCLFIINPSSGKHIIQKTLDVLIGQLVLKQLVHYLDIYYTKGHNDAYEYLQTITYHQYDFIVSVGGDGTQNEVVSGIIDAKIDIPILILAAGTVNDLATYLKLPNKMNEIIQLIEDFHITTMDVGCANHSYFINVLAGGMFSDIGFKVDKRQKQMLGPLAYYLNGLFDLPNQLSSTMDLQFKVDDEIINEEAYLFLITNSSSVGGFQISPIAAVTDGKFDLLIVKKCKITDLIALSKDFLLNRHLESPFLIYRQAKHIEISSSKLVELDLDGEKGGCLPIDVKVLPKAIKIITPKPKSDKNG